MNQIIEFIPSNWVLLVAFVAIIACVVMIIKKFFSMPNEEKLNQVREWLLWAVTQAEIELGSGTGELKLRYVYDMFVTKFPYIAPFLSFEKFTELVNEALDKLEDLLDKSEEICDYVYQEDEE